MLICLLVVSQNQPHSVHFTVWNKRAFIFRSNIPLWSTFHLERDFLSATECTGRHELHQIASYTRVWKRVCAIFFCHDAVHSVLLLLRMFQTIPLLLPPLSITLSELLEEAKRKKRSGCEEKLSRDWSLKRNFRQLKRGEGRRDRRERRSGWRESGGGQEEGWRVEKIAEEERNAVKKVGWGGSELGWWGDNKKKKKNRLDRSSLLSKTTNDANRNWRLNKSNTWNTAQRFISTFSQCVFQAFSSTFIDVSSIKWPCV